jgi:ribosomal-protein-alanine N-acetyltransferase
MTAADIPAVRRIEVVAYEDAWPQTVFEDELRNAFATYLVVLDRSPGHPPARPPSWWSRLLGRTPPREDVPLIAFCGAWFHVDQLHVVTIAVAPGFQGRGIAQRLLLECFDRAAAAELRNVALEVRPSNARALAIYERFGFRQVGVHRAYYANNGEDALVMLTPDLDTPEQRARLDSIRGELRRRYPSVDWLITEAPVSAR